jgi:hypothetical protein
LSACLTVLAKISSTSSSRRKRFDKYVLPVARAQANIYAWLFKRQRWIVEIFSCADLRLMRSFTLKETYKLTGVGYRTALRYLSKDLEYLKARLSAAR